MQLQFRLIDINHKRRYPKHDPFILALQASQVYYSKYPGDARVRSYWLAVCKTKARYVVDSLVDRSSQADVDDDNILCISLMVDLGPFTHEFGVNEVLDYDEGVLGEENNEGEDENEDKWETDTKTDEDDGQYLLEDGLSE
jgi:hypothetical protein